MSEVRYQVETYQVNYKCDVEGCGGLMQPTGITLLSHPPQYPHQCQRCHAVVNLRERYPRIEYRTMGDLPRSYLND